MPQIDWMHVIALAFGAASAYVMQRFGQKPADPAFPIPPTTNPATPAPPPTFRVILVKEDPK